MTRQCLKRYMSVFVSTGSTIYETTPRITEDIDVRLVDGSSISEGRVEVRRPGGDWGTVCDDGWDDRDARVVCRQLGHPTTDARAVSEARYGYGEGSILLDSVRCKGTESNLGSCSSYEWGVHNCHHSEDAGVNCGKINGDLYPDIIIIIFVSMKRGGVYSNVLSVPRVPIRNTKQISQLLSYIMGQYTMAHVMPILLYICLYQFPVSQTPNVRMSCGWYSM